jgi:phosphate starvation-inducible protein PhoH and related proteins
MFLTRLGFGSKAVITGDITQIDLPTGRVSGLVEAIRVVNAIEGIAFVHFDERDVVRHKLVQQIVKAYEAFSNGAPRDRRGPMGRAPIDIVGSSGSAGATDDDGNGSARPGLDEVLSPSTDAGRP